MSFFLDLDDDYEIFDNQEQVRYTRPGESTTVSVCAVRRQLSVREAAASGGAYTVRDVQFSIPRSKVCSSPPEVGSLLQSDADEFFTVLAVDKATLKSRYRVTCREPVLHSQLDEQLILEQVSYELDRTNAPYEVWTTAAQVLGKIYVNSEMEELRANNQRPLQDISIYLSGSPEIEPNWRIRDQQQNTYLVKKVVQPHLGGLTVVTAVQQNTPALM